MEKAMAMAEIIKKSGTYYNHKNNVSGEYIITNIYLYIYINTNIYFTIRT